MSDFELEVAESLEITRQSAQAIVNDIGGIVRQRINMMNREGVIIASTDAARIGTPHEGAREIIDKKLPELYITPECATYTTRVGLNLPIIYLGEIVGVIGITGDYDEVKDYGQIVKKMVEILIRENVGQNERRLNLRVLSRFLEDWVMGDGLLQPQALAERGYKLGIDISLPRRVMVVSAGELEQYMATPDGQKLIEKIENEIAMIVEQTAGNLILRNTGRQILLLRFCDDKQVLELAEGLKKLVWEKYQVHMAIGIDGRTEDIHTAYGQANKAWRGARRMPEGILSYSQVTLELFAEDISKQVKIEYLHKVFRTCSYEELCRWIGLLEAYFNAEGSLKAAAEALYIHKNTLTYKLKKLAELTGYDVRQISHVVVFYMAMIFFKDVKGDLEF